MAVNTYELAPTIEVAPGDDLNAASTALGLGGGVVLLDHGVYTLTATLQMKNGVTFKSASGNPITTVLDASALGASPAISGFGIGESAFLGIGVNGGATLTGACVLLGSMSRCRIEHCYFSGFTGSCLSVSAGGSCVGLSFAHNEIDGSLSPAVFLVDLQDGIYGGRCSFNKFSSVQSGAILSNPPLGAPTVLAAHYDIEGNEIEMMTPAAFGIGFLGQATGGYLINVRGNRVFGGFGQAFNGPGYTFDVAGSKEACIPVIGNVAHGLLGVAAIGFQTLNVPVGPGITVTGNSSQNVGGAFYALAANTVAAGNA